MMPPGVAQVRLGRQTARITRPVAVASSAAVAGEKEAQGPLGERFDRTYGDDTMGLPSFEQAEAQLLKEAIVVAVQKAGRSPGDVDRLFAGDLLDQNVTSSFAAMGLEIPFYGVYGACATAAEALSLAALAVEAGHARLAVAATASHHLAAERQYRFPVELGVQRTPTAQWTATGAAAFVVGEGASGPRITEVTAGVARSLGIKDPNNMGAAMAPAAAHTLGAHFADTGRTPDDYDMILTGDLGLVGRELCKEILRDEGQREIEDERFLDAGLLLYRRRDQDVHAGGSGAACSALGLAAFLLPALAQGRFRRALFVATGALHSPTTYQQGLPIPAIAHAVALEGGDGP